MAPLYGFTGATFGKLSPRGLTAEELAAFFEANSLRFDLSKVNYMTRTPSAFGNTRTFTWSGWVKRCSSLGASQMIFGVDGTTGSGTNLPMWFDLFFNTSNELQLYWEHTGGYGYFYSNQLFRDVGAWYHLVLTVDTTQSTASNRIKVYVNGQQITWRSSTGSGTGSTGPGYPNQNLQMSFNSNARHYIGRRVSENNYTLDALLTNYYLVDGQALTPSDFAYTDPVTNIWRPKEYNPLTVTDTYSAGVALNQTPYADAGSSNCTITNNGSITSSSAGTNSFGLTNAADMTGTQRIDLNMGNVSSTFFQSAWTLEMFFKTSNISDGTWFVGTAQDGSTWQSGWAIHYQSGSLQWAYDSPSGGSLKSLGIALSSNTWYFMRIQRTPGSSTALKAWVYDSPTSLVGSFSGTVSDTATHTNNILKIGDANGNANNLTANWQFANVMLTAGTVRNQEVPTLSNGVRVNNTTVSLTSYDNFGQNGFYLPFNSNNLIGADQSGITNANNGTIWSSSFTAPNSGFGNTIPPQRAFDGNLSTLAGTNNSTSANLLFTKTFTNVTRLRVWADHSTGYRMRVNGGTWYSDSTLGASANASWRDLTSIIPAGGTITSIEADTNGVNNGVNWAAIEVNGTILLDGVVGNSWTPVNFGGSAALDKATGALPILRTVSGGKVATAGVRTDSNSANLVLALPLVGNKEDVSANINGSGSNKTITNTSVTFSSLFSNFYGGSSYFNGSAYLRAPASSDFTYGTGDFTFEGWIYPTTSADQVIYGQTSSGNNFINIALTPTTNYLSAQINSSGAGNNVTSTIPVTLNTWNHIAVTRESTVVKLFINGVLSGSGTRNVDLSLASIQPTIGTYSHTSSLNFNGYIQDFRIYKGVAKYTSNFIPASTDPDILPDVMSAESDTTNAALTAITDGAVSFDGSGDYLALPNNDTDFQFDGNFTVELFVYAPTISSSSSYQYLIEYARDGNNGWGIAFQNNQLYGFFGSGSNGFGPGTDTQLTQGSWNHIAWTRETNQHYVYINGRKITGNSVSGTQPSTDASNVLNIGRFMNNTSYFTGMVSNVRIIKGTALYTSNFTPPTAPLTSVANTKLLCCKSQTDARVAEIAPTTTFNDGRNWTSTLSTNTGGFSSSYPAADAFDGTITNYTNTLSTTGSPNPITLTFTPSSTLTGITKLRVYTDNIGDNAYATGTISVNGGSEATHTDLGVSSFALGWVDITSLVPSGSLSNFRIRQTNKGSYTLSLRIYAIEVNGVILVNNSFANINGSGNIAASNFNPFTTDITTVRGNQSGYATWDPLAGDNAASPTPATFTNGNLTVSYNRQSSGAPWCPGTIAIPSSGKWYWECIPTASSPTPPATIPGISNIADSKKGVNSVNKRGIYLYDGQKVTVNAYSSYASAFAVGDTVGIAVNMDSGVMGFYKNGIYLGDAFTDLLSSGITWIPFLGMGGQNSGTTDVNFGQKPFKFPPPTGYKPLNLANLPTPAITKGSDYMNAVTYTGNGSNLTVNTGFKPDLVWCKIRTPNAYNHTILDSVRGFTKSLSSSMTVQEYTEPTGPVAITSNGFTLNGDVTYVGSVNQNGSSYVAWCWKAGGNSNTFNINDVGYATASAAGLTAGTITPTGASVNTTSGFSIVKYTGTGSAATVSHGLQNTPQFLIVKRTDIADRYWMVYHTSTGNTNRLVLNDTSDVSANSLWWNNTSPTSSVFSLGADPGNFSNSTNASGGTYIAYLWAEIPGFSKFGSYIGNSSADGPVIITGFRPKWILIKANAAGEHWIIIDSVRDTYNLSDAKLSPSSAAIENDGTSVGGDGTNAIDILSNGFKLRTSNSRTNQNNTYIYAAFAEAPQQISNAR